MPKNKRKQNSLVKTSKQPRKNSKEEKDTILDKQDGTESTSQTTHTTEDRPDTPINNTGTTQDDIELTPGRTDATQSKTEATPRRKTRSSVGKGSPKKGDVEVNLEGLPQEYANIHKALCDLALSIQNSTKANVLGNKKVFENFSDVQQILEGLTTPRKDPPTPSKYEGSKQKKRKKSELKEEKDELSDKLEKGMKISKESEETEKNFKKLQADFDKLEKDFSNEKVAHQATKAENKREKEELDKNNRELKEKYKELRSNLSESGKELQKKGKELQETKEELENVRQKMKDSIEKQRNEYAVVKNQLTQTSTELKRMEEKIAEKSTELELMNKELKKKDDEINELRNRLSSLSASKLEGDPTLTDLGDPNRPLKLVDRYQQLYDNSWTDAFDELMESYTDVDDNSDKEKKAASEILTIFQDILQFCQRVVEDQEKTVQSTLMCCSNDELDQTNDHVDITAIRNIRKSNAHQIIPFVQKAYFKHNERELTDYLKGFTEECLAMCWLSQVQDPPMAFEYNYDRESHFDKEYMREFTVSGDQLDYVVWPTLRLKKDGPVMVKSVVQPIKRKR